MLDRAGFPNREVARRTGVAGETVSRWRSGQQGIGDAELLIIIEMLREKGIAVSRGWIRYGEEPSARVDALHHTAEVPDVPVIDHEVVEVPDPRQTTRASRRTGSRRSGS